MRRRATLLGCVSGLIISTITACGTSEEDMQRELEEAADRARQAIYSIADDVGQDPEVTDDVIIDCVPGDDSSGKTLSITVAVTVGADALDRLPDLAQRYASDGWETQLREGGNRLSLGNDVASVLVAVFPDEGRANIIGDSRCVR